MIFNMRKDKILFVFKRYKYDNNKISTSENLPFCRLFHLLLLYDLSSLLLKINQTRIISI